MDKPQSLIRAEKEVALKMMKQMLHCDSYEELRQICNDALVLLDELNL